MVDTSIPLQYRPTVQLDSPQEAQMKALTLRQLMNQGQMDDMKMDAAMQDQRQQRTLSDLLRSNTGADGTVNHNAVQQGLAQAGASKALFGYQKQRAEADKAGADLANVRAQADERGAKTQAELFKLRIEKSNTALKDISALQTPEEARESLLSHVRAGDIDQEKGLQLHQSIPQHPAEFARWKLNMLTRILDAKSQLEAQLPSLEKVDNGKQITYVDKNPLTNPGGPQPITKTTTPGEDQTAATQRRGQNMTDARARDFNAITSAGVNAKNETDLRKEFADLPEVKNYKAAYPAFAAIKDASTRTTPQAEINLIYGLAKLYDPTSVVREGEYATIANSQAIPEWLKGQAQRIAGGGRLSAETKAQIMQEASGRIGTFEEQYLGSQGTYREVAAKRGMNPAAVFTPVGRIGPDGAPGAAPKPAPAAAPAAQPKPAASGAPKIGAIEDGHVYVGGDPSQASSWKKVTK